MQKKFPYLVRILRVAWPANFDFNIYGSWGNIGQFSSQKCPFIRWRPVNITNGGFPTLFRERVKFLNLDNLTKYSDKHRKYWIPMIPISGDHSTQFKSIPFLLKSPPIRPSQISLKSCKIWEFILHFLFGCT